MYKTKSRDENKNQNVKDRNIYLALYALYVITNRKKKLSNLFFQYYNKELAISSLVTITKKAIFLLYLDLHPNSSFSSKPKSIKSFYIGNREFDIE